MTRVAEHIRPEATGFAGTIGAEHEQPLQIRTNPFVVGRSRSPIFDARIYLGERATSIGRPNLFAPEALDVVIRGTRGALGELRVVAELAFFAAASGGASQIGPMHVLRALEARGGNNDDVDGSERDIEQTTQGPPDSPIISDVTQPPAVETVRIAVPDVARDEILQHADVDCDTPAQRTEAQGTLRLWSWRGRPFAHSAAITGALLVSFTIAGLVSSQLMSSNSNGPKSLPVPVSQPADFAPVVPSPAAPVTEASPEGPIGTENDPSVGGKDSARAASASKVVAASKRKRPRVRRRARAANPVSEQVSAEAAANQAPTASDDVEPANP